jgi:hypothetical protein
LQLVEVRGARRIELNSVFGAAAVAVNLVSGRRVHVRVEPERRTPADRHIGLQRDNVLSRVEAAIGLHACNRRVEAVGRRPIPECAVERDRPKRNRHGVSPTNDLKPSR